MRGLIYVTGGWKVQCKKICRTKQNNSKTIPRKFIHHEIKDNSHSLGRNLHDQGTVIEGQTASDLYTNMIPAGTRLRRNRITVASGVFLCREERVVRNWRWTSKY